MKKILFLLVLAGVLLATGTAIVFAASGDVTNPNTLRELAEARKATKQYINAELPIADGAAGPYVQASPYIPGMGYHYVNLALMDDVFDPARPEILLYANTGDGRRLVGVEYAVMGDIPEGFSGDDDVWEFHDAACHYADDSEIIGVYDPADCPATHPDTGAPFVTWHPPLGWVLHAWIWEGNPDGIFEAFNPNLP